jgi:DNA-binding MarR family transcriptional regulator
VLGELREEIADAFQIDDKTVAARIKSMEVGGLVNLAKDSMDRRRTLVTPTTSLVDAFTRYSDYLIDIQAIFSEQIDKRNRISRVREPLKEISFDLLGHVKETKGAPSPEVETVPVAMPTIVEASKARK